MNFYSQYAEDVLLDRIFGDHKGNCVEVGANDGVKFSNTKHFEELGWQCILVEPTPNLCAAIRQARVGLLFECAASSHEGTMDFYVVEGHDLYSSLEAHATMFASPAHQNARVNIIPVQVRRLDSIITESGVNAIDFISIDVEGHELAVLEGFTIDRWKPKLVLVEDASELEESPVQDFLQSFNYKRFYRSGGNDWYARSDISVLGLLWVMVGTGRLEFRGIGKVWLPRKFVRWLLTFKRGISS